MRRGKVYNNNILAGIIDETDNGQYAFKYTTEYFIDRTKPAISLTIPKTSQAHYSKTLFAFFFNLLSEGENKKLQCNNLKIDENDHFGLLLKTANEETIGAIRVQELIENDI
ncbi:MAG: HipA N-terminal domain-containing protein [Chitinophagaceae bacterium]